MNIMDDQREISTGQSEFAAIIHAHSAGTRQICIGFQSGNTDAEVMWLPKFDIWAYLGDPPFEKSPGERFWNVFGIGEPHGMVPIICEVNPPKHGINRQAAGGFARDASGAIYLIHRESSIPMDVYQNPGSGKTSAGLGFLLMTVTGLLM